MIIYYILYFDFYPYHKLISALCATKTVYIARRELQLAY